MNGMSEQVWRLSEVVPRLEGGGRAQERIGDVWGKHAAVAMTLFERRPEAGVELLMIQRARHEGDPWSGHMGFPGGRMESEDAGPLAAALRECQEEIDLDLSRYARHLGALSPLPAMAGGKIVPMLVHPFLFVLQELPPLRPCSREVDEIVWVPLRLFLDPTQRQTMDYRKAGVDWKLPCYRFEGHTIWGLSLRMIDELCERLQTAL